MARKPDIQYIQYVTDGSSARVLQPAKKKARTNLPVIRLPELKEIRIDPLALAGIFLSVLMVALMVVNFVQLAAVQKEANAMDAYVDQLETENARLTDKYKSGYDLQDIREKALALGLVPVEEVQRITVNVHQPPAEDRVGETDNFMTFLTGLFD